MATFRKKLKINWWRLLKNVNRIGQLIEDVRALYEKVKDMSDDPVLKNRIRNIEETIDELFG